MGSTMGTFNDMGDALTSDMEPGDPESSVVKDEAAFFVSKIPRGMGKKAEFTSGQGKVVIPDLDAFGETGDRSIALTVRSFIIY